MPKRNLPTKECPNKCGDPKCLAKPWSIDTTKTPIIWLLGGPGSGKTTICEKLVKKYKVVHLSAGELLRQEIKNKSKRSQRLIALVSKGALVPNHIILELLYEAMLLNYENARGFLIDDYPKEARQGQAFDEVFAPCNLVLYLDTSDKVLKERLLARIEKGSDRPDDTEKTIKLQIKTFHDHNDKIVALYKDKLKTVNASLSFDEVFDQVVTILDPLIFTDPNDNDEDQESSHVDENEVSGSSKDASKV